jgi:hypothetical protein
MAGHNRAAGTLTSTVSIPLFSLQILISPRQVMRHGGGKSPYRPTLPVPRDQNRRSTRSYRPAQGRDFPLTWRRCGFLGLRMRQAKPAKKVARSSASNGHLSEKVKRDRVPPRRRIRSPCPSISIGMANEDDAALMISASGSAMTRDAVPICFQSIPSATQQPAYDIPRVIRMR